MEKCVHGYEVRECVRDAPGYPLQPAWRVTRTGEPVVSPWPAYDNGMVPVFQLGNRGALGMLKVNDLIEVERFGSNLQEHIDTVRRFQEHALDVGMLFRPQRPLAYREGTEEGPSRCQKCHRLLSFESGNLGCTGPCKCYVCRCGCCLCGFKGTNYLGQFFEIEQSSVPPPDERLEHIRVFRLCEADLKMWL